MDYVSTRGSAEPTNFRSVVLSGMASDGGLYVPESLPRFDSEAISSWSWLPFDELAFRVISPFVGGEIESSALRSILKDCYQCFDHRAVAPLQQIGPNEWVLQLHHGPTQASKDFAAQLQSRLVAHFLTLPSQAVVIGATNGDTGLAAVEAFKDVPNVKVLALYPQDGVPADRLAGLMGSSSDHVRLIEVSGSFDDCQTGFQSAKSLAGERRPSNKFQLYELGGRLGSDRLLFPQCFAAWWRRAPGWFQHTGCELRRDLCLLHCPKNGAGNQSGHCVDQYQ